MVLVWLNVIFQVNIALLKQWDFTGMLEINGMRASCAIPNASCATIYTSVVKIKLVRNHPGGCKWDKWNSHLNPDLTSPYIELLTNVNNYQMFFHHFITQPYSTPCCLDKWSCPANNNNNNNNNNNDNNNILKNLQNHCNHPPCSHSPTQHPAT